ncbi:MAG: glycosyltransferase family 2 protein [Desulfobulbaceae bacterium]|nr:glycosyltransferase family 2 protein [Desulfobulbaceae bacterium]
MILVMSLLVKDEVDVIRENIEYHRKIGVDHFLVIDNASTDGTTDILDEYRQKGYLDYTVEPGPYSQSEWVTGLARRAFCDFNADWIINNDGDEFWWCDCANLKREFAKYSKNIQKVKARRHNMLPSGSPSSAPFYKRMIKRRKVSINSAGKFLLPKVAGRGAVDIVVHAGSHDISYSSPAASARSGIEIFHYPYRSHEQLVSKVINIGQGYARNPQIDPKTGRKLGGVMRSLYAEYLNDPISLKRFYEGQIFTNAGAWQEQNPIVEDLRMCNAISSAMSSNKSI